MRPMTAAMAAVHEEVHTAAQPEEKDQRQITYDMCLMLLPQEEPGDRQETQKYQSRKPPCSCSVMMCPFPIAGYYPCHPPVPWTI